MYCRSKYKSQYIKLLEENIGGNLRDLGFDDEFLNTI